MEEQRRQITTQLRRVQEEINAEKANAGGSTNIAPAGVSYEAAWTDYAQQQQQQPTLAVDGDKMPTVRRSFLMTDEFDMEAQRLTFAAQCEAAQVTAAPGDIQESGAGNVLLEDALNTAMDEPADKEKEAPEVFVEAELVAPLASPPRTPNLYQIGADLEREAKKTASEQRAAEQLELQMSESTQARKLALEDARELLETSSHTANPIPEYGGIREFSLPDSSKELNEAANELAEAADNSKRRLAALRRTREALLEMQAEMDAMTDRLKQRIDAKEGTDESGDETAQENLSNDNV